MSSTVHRALSSMRRRTAFMRRRRFSNGAWAELARIPQSFWLATGAVSAPCEMSLVTTGRNRMLTKDIAYTIDGKTYTGYLADDESRKAKRPGVLVCHQGMGLTEHAKERARMLAQLGYVAFALDMYGRVATSRDDVMSLIGELTANPAELQKRAEAGLNVLKDQPNTDKQRL